MTEVEEMLAELYIGENILTKEDEVNEAYKQGLNKQIIKNEVKYGGYTLTPDQKDSIPYIVGKCSKQFKGKSDYEIVKTGVNIYKDGFESLSSWKAFLTLLIGLASAAAFIVPFCIFVDLKTWLKVLICVLSGALLFFLVVGIFVTVLEKKPSENDYRYSKKVIGKYLEKQEEYQKCLKKVNSWLDKNGNLNKSVFAKMEDTKKDYEEYKKAEEAFAIECCILLAKLEYSDVCKQLTAELENAESTFENRQRQHEEQLSKLKDELKIIERCKKEFFSNLKVMPIAYVSDSKTIRKLMILLLNKRANNVTDLINLYETEKFREKVLEAVDSQYQLTFSTAQSKLIELASEYEKLKLIFKELSEIDLNQIETNSTKSRN